MAHLPVAFVSEFPVAAYFLKYLLTYLFTCLDLPGLAKRAGGERAVADLRSAGGGKVNRRKIKNTLQLSRLAF